MRRKVIQHFANMLPQRFLDLPSGYDLATFARIGHGIAFFDILNGRTKVDGDPCENLRTCDEYRSWLRREMARHKVSNEGLTDASMRVSFEVTNYLVEQPFGHVFRSADFSFECVSAIRTDEREYSCSRAGAKRWGYDWYWEQLFGSDSR